MKILVNCIVYSPYKGSEPGMGWSFISQMSKYHELFILVETNFKTDIDNYLSEHPDEKKNKNFVYLTKKPHVSVRSKLFQKKSKLLQESKSTFF